jgi:plasmid maintenance system antidote protein VapI
MRAPASRLALILAGRRGITADTALHLARLFGMSAQLWMNLQSQYELGRHGARARPADHSGDCQERTPRMAANVHQFRR